MFALSRAAATRALLRSLTSIPSNFSCRIHLKFISIFYHHEHGRLDSFKAL
jgi:hypothetical protein